MIRPLFDEKEIANAFAVFSRSVMQGGRQVQSIVGYQGGNEEATLTWHADKKFWVVLEPNRLDNRFWCVFGIEDPSSVPMVSITCEINPPRSVISRQCAGLFIRDSNRLVYLAHSGKVGGGRAGIGKSAFLSTQDYNNIVPVMFPDGKESEYIVIGQIDHDDFLDDLAKFVHAVAEFKQEAVTKVTNAQNQRKIELQKAKLARV